MTYCGLRADVRAGRSLCEQKSIYRVLVNRRGIPAAKVGRKPAKSGDSSQIDPR
jgi:hypothetical protein